MVDVKTEIKLTPWPSPQDYNEAIQNLVANTESPELRKGKVQTNALGLPRSVTGAFASVYRVGSAEADIAVRCFLRDIGDQEARYKLISEFVQNDSLPYTVSFDFMAKGIRVGQTWYPALKMDWVDGANLDLFIESHLDSADVLAKLADSFKSMCYDLREAGIAHGDLQHGNIIVCGDELRLVDYDGMYVPSMQGMQANELGHRNYQHPLRTPEEFGDHLDNFSAWVIYASLRAVALDKSLWELLAGGDDCLLFRRDDFVDPEHSYSFAVLEHHPNEEIRALAKFLRWQCHCAMRDVPPLSEDVPKPPSFIGDLTAVMTRTRRSPQTFAQVQPQPQTANNLRNFKKNVPDWLNNNSTANAVVSARPQPKAPPSRVQRSPVPLGYHHVGAGIEPELRHPDRVAVPNNRSTRRISRFERGLIQRGDAVRTESFSVVNLLDDYVVNYSFRTVQSKRLIKVSRPISREQFEKLKDVQEATVLCETYEPQTYHKLYDLMSCHAATMVVPTGIEPELKQAKREVKFRDERFIHPALMHFILAIPMLAIIGSGFVISNAIGLSLVFGWLLTMVYSAFSIATNRALVQKGIPARATVQLVEKRPDGTFLVEYTFHSLQGSVTGKVTLGADQNEMKKGDVLTVLYDALKPDKNVLYKLAMYDAV